MSNSVKTKRGAHFQQKPISNLIRLEHLGKRSFEYEIFTLSFKFEKMATECIGNSTQSLLLINSGILEDLNLKQSDIKDISQTIEVQTRKFWSAYKLTVSNTLGETQEVYADFDYYEYTYPEYKKVTYAWPKRKPRDTSKFSKPILPDFGFISDYLKLLDSD